MSTYRVQVTADHDLFAVADRLSYLHDVGADWVYLSPILAAEPGSAHGYDVVAHDHVDAARGGAAGLAAVARAARELGMGVLVDIVPNHMGVASPAHNPWWWELLRDGRDSAGARRFDVDWEAGDGRIRIPVVGDDDLRPDGTVDHLEVVDGELRYHDHRFPVASGTAGEGRGAAAVHARQHYELVSWRRADDELNYRRFFAVNTLAGIRVEDPEVFRESHQEVARWFAEDLVDGLRIDHPDGLRDPAGYLRALADVTGGAYVLVEKILEPGEALESGWACAGTTGYDALAWVDRVLVDPAGQQPLEELETRLRGGRVDYAELVHSLKRDVADGILRSEVRRLVREVRTGADPEGVADDALEDALAELLACFPVYRSYLPVGAEHLRQAFVEARGRRPELAAAYDALVTVLNDPRQPAALRFQQTSGMVMAKGVEDCAFYRYSRLTSLNEVGGDPAVFSVSPAQLHEWAGQRQREWPRAMTASSTHDTKRGEDVRARIDVLAEVPGEWATFLDGMQRLAPLPDGGFANLLWQATVGAWPLTRDRLHAYAEKAMREAGEHTTWTAPDEAYEGGVHRGVDAVFDHPHAHDLVVDMAGRLAGPGWSNALAAKLLTLCLPGVPDVYQGSEVWEQSLVDPDNRRPVDFDQALARLQRLADDPVQLGDALDEPGLAKLAVTRAALLLRRERPALFEGYRALEAVGPARGHALAFDRGGAIAVVTRLPVGLAARGGWDDTRLELPPGRWVEQVTGSVHSGVVALSDLLADLPVALLAVER